MSREERERYVFRLARRVCERVATITGGASVPPSVWEDIRIADDMLVEAALAYERGEVEKEELDQKAVGYLNHWRDVWKAASR